MPPHNMDMAGHLLIGTPVKALMLLPMVMITATTGLPGNGKTLLRIKKRSGNIVLPS